MSSPGCAGLQRAGKFIAQMDRLHQSGGALGVAVDHLAYQGYAGFAHIGILRYESLQFRYTAFAIEAAQDETGSPFGCRAGFLPASADYRTRQRTATQLRLPFVKHFHIGDAANVELLGDLVVFFGIELYQFYLSACSAYQLFDDRPSTRQGLHHTAQKSTTTGFSKLFQ